MEQETNKLMEIFFPYLSGKMNEIKRSKKKMVHYTSAQAALSILKNKEVWLRQPDCMNDYLEVTHGMQCLQHAYGAGEKRFKTAIDQIGEGFSLEIEQCFDEVLNQAKKELYILCISEHEFSEDKYGRLSMWRAYGANAGVAIVLKHEVFSEDDSTEDNEEEEETYEVSLPVAYLSSESLIAHLDRIASKILEELEYLKSLNRDALRGLILQMLKWIVLSTKHPGFAEENEWRIIYCPGEKVSPLLKHGIESINGFPQEIYKMPLDQIEKNSGGYFSFNELIDRVIIGPCNHPIPVKKAFVKILSENGIEDAHERVIISEIPLRT